jgi:hypothetical protein
MPNALLTARAPWKGVGGGSLFSGLARPYSSGYYQGPERSSGLLGDSPIDIFAIADLVDRDFLQIVINLIHQAIVALPHTVKVTEAGKFLASVLPRVFGQGLNLPNQSLPVGFATYRQ